MRSGCSFMGTFVLSVALLGSLGSLGCGPHRVRVYDPYHSDYHRWNHGEVVYYQQWETEGHRDHRELADRSKEEQRDYWDWRHQNDHH